jgi:hypothetical protein
VHIVKKISIGVVLIILVAGIASFQLGRVDAGEKLAQASAPPAAPAQDGLVRGKVVETMNTSGYTYALVDTGSETLWLAGPETLLKVGDTVEAPQGFPMEGYHSKSLERDFDVVYFVAGIRSTSGGAGASAAAPAMPAGHPSTDSAAKPAPVAIEVAPLQPGQDIAYVYANRQELAGQSLSIRGKVVKFNENILGRNWIHLQDGSGSPTDGNSDLTVTTDAVVTLGATVVASGTVVLDKDFGAGYSYPILLEQATVKAE